MTKLSFGWVAILGLFVLGFSACDDDDPVVNEPQTLSELVADDDRFTTLLGALESTGLDFTLNQPGPYTVFAPTDAAFTASGVDLTALSTDELRNVLLYHVVSGAILPSNNIQEGITSVTSANATGPNDTQLSLLVERTGSDINVNGLNVTEADIEGSNGVIHVIDNVLLPPTVVDLAASVTPLSSLVDAIGAAADIDASTTVAGALSGDGPFTVFAPDNTAFAAAPSGLSAEQLRDVLLYHVVSGNVRSDAIPASAPTLNGEELSFSGTTITTTSGQTVNITFTDIQGTNGVVHLINAVMVPGDL
ncbi:fasciclin domain-containing protein [Lewinella sp. W8]|uniref:fasciclin domain-containing protein n=1 Tax=Lewinella sp. W8 TaxID=2528208 RepID=UPI001068C03C|nr:fasciclin domain-containing protein [Lewinella sp. W8]MTB52403.1 fasciclin domain-containing protein [Lewinella sp. W8]